MRLCVCSGVGIVNPCAAFVVSGESLWGTGTGVPPPKAEPLRQSIKPLGAAEITTKQERGHKT